MKVFFKVWNILLLIATAIPAVLVLIGALGLGAVSAELGGSDGAFGGLAAIFAIIGLIPAVMTIIMAIAGQKDDYEKCSKIAFYVLVLDVVMLFMTENKGSAIFQIIMLIVYIVLAKKLQRIW